MTKIRAAITGIHGWTPEDVLTNSDLEKMVDTTDAWITTRTGIKERHILKGEKGTSDLAVEAVRGLLEKTGTDPEEVDMLICATVTPDMQFPATANLVSHKLGIKNAFSFDMNAACSTFIYALITGSKYVESGEYKKVVVIGGDKMSSIVDYTDRATCVIFGDGAGAVMLEPVASDEPGIMDHRFYTDGAGWVHLHQKAGGSLKPASHTTVDAREHFIYQEGQPVFKFAVTRMADVAAEIMERNQLKSEDVAWLVPHQANLRIIDATARRMGVSKDKVMINIQRYGNTTNGTIPLCLYEWEPQLKKGDNVVLAAFGGGFTWGAVYLKWAYDPK